MLSLAARKLSQEVHLIQQDATRAAEYVPQGSIDLAMSHFLLNFVELDQLLQTSLKLLRPGGVLSLVTSTQQSLAELHTDRFPKTARLLGAKRSLNQMSTPQNHQQCLEKLRAQGFEIVEENLWRQPVSFNSFDDIRSWAVDSGWMVSSFDKNLGLRMALGRAIVGIFELSMHPFYPLEASTEISIVLARKPEQQDAIQVAA
jgi:SAM-dependent methyltransferase